MAITNFRVLQGIDIIGDTIETSIINGTADPRDGAGVAAPLGSIYQRDVDGNGTVGQVWNKLGPTDTEWVLTGEITSSTEDGFQNTFMGKLGFGEAGNENPAYSSTNVVTQSSDLTTAIGDLDAEVGVAVTPEARTNFQTSDQAINLNIDALDSAIGNDVQLTGAQIVDVNDTVYENLLTLDTTVSTLLSGINYLGTFDPNETPPITNTPNGVSPIDGNTTDYNGGDLFVVNVAGHWNFTTGDQTNNAGADNEFDLDVGDKMFYNGDLTWEVVENVDAVSSVFGRTGAVVAVAGDYDAIKVDYDNTTSLLTATDVQTAIDELVAGALDQDLSEVLAVGNTTGANNILIQDNFGILGEDSADAFFSGGNSTTNGVDAGDGQLLGGSSAPADGETVNAGNALLRGGIAATLGTGVGDGGHIIIEGGLGVNGGVNGSINIGTGATLDTNITAGNDVIVTAINDVNLSATNDLIFNANTWPSADGNTNDVLTTNGAGQLSFADLSTISPVETLAETLAEGNITGGNDISITDGDIIVGENMSSASGGAVQIFGGNSTSGSNKGGGIFIFAGSSSDEGGDIDMGGGTGPNSHGAVRIGTSIATKSLSLGDGSSNLVIIHNNTYPVADGTDGQVITTDGAGNLTFQDQGVTAASEDGVTTETIVDSVLIDDVSAVKWIVTAEDGTNRNSFEVNSIHDGIGATDATIVDFSQFVILRTNGVAITGLSLDVGLSGAGASQVMELKVTSTASVNVRVSRIDVAI